MSSDMTLVEPPARIDEPALVGFDAMTTELTSTTPVVGSFEPLTTRQAIQWCTEWLTRAHVTSFTLANISFSSYKGDHGRTWMRARTLHDGDIRIIYAWAGSGKTTAFIDTSREVATFDRTRSATVEWLLMGAETVVGAARDGLVGMVSFFASNFDAERERMLGRLVRLRRCAEFETVDPEVDSLPPPPRVDSTPIQPHAPPGCRRGSATMRPAPQQGGLAAA